MALITGLLAALKFAPSVFAAGQSIYNAVTGEDPPPEAVESEEAFARHVEGLPPEQRDRIVEQTIAAKVAIQRADTERFVAMTDGTAEKIRATARPEIARRAMGVIERFSRILVWLGALTVLQWAVGWLGPLVSNDFRAPASIWDEIAKMAPVAEMIWAPTLAALYACLEVIKKYMGCRERDKAMEAEIRAGRPLKSTQATIEAAGGAIGGIVRAIKGK
ncbi:hypothetical protein KAJ83_09675 [Marivibrio halodurans]|uniref:Holin of 3TMs, for gene-transfer release n=1 Tax=Marivibrio halodurans TaxID=2039722 RepID=A0A8J7V2U7_9PROT|nr:hypothetical protein [Marivibrio halodurans]MBP5857277.1 hypothetical protein [Marivibrio halodurans]